VPRGAYRFDSLRPAAVHGLIFFYIQKFAETAARGARPSVATGATRYLPSGVYPDAAAVELLQALAESTGRSLPDTLEQFGHFLAPHLLKVAGRHVDPGWQTLDLIEHTEAIIHAMIRTANPGALPPVLETVRPALDELHLIYGSQRQLCPLARGLMRGIATHYHEELEIDEPSCMHRGDPFCSFVIRRLPHDTHAASSALADTTDVVRGAEPAIATPVAPTADDSLPPTIGGYTIVQLIGRGGMGRVYLARDEQLRRDVAIKVLHPSKARDPAATRRFLREGRAAAAVDHPHVMTIHQVGDEQGLPYIVMQLLVGRTLKEARQAEGPLPLPEVLRIGREIAEGLAAAHRQGLVHRDIKPDNVFLQEPHGQVRIIDFGLARTGSDDGLDVTVDGSIVGTPAYMSPERVEGGTLDAKSDLFGLGVILYELLAGRLPFEGTSLVSMLAAIARGMPADLGTVAPDVPEPVARLVMRLIAHDKAARPADAATVAAELTALERTL